MFVKNVLAGTAILALLSISVAQVLESRPQDPDTSLIGPPDSTPIPVGSLLNPADPDTEPMPENVVPNPVPEDVAPNPIPEGSAAIPMPQDMRQIPLLQDIAPLALQQAEISDDQFVFDLAGSEPLFTGPGGAQRNIDRNTIDGMRLSNGRNGGGGTQTMFAYEPCGFRTPHVHPRGTENFFIIQGEVTAVFLRENGSLVANPTPGGFGGFFPEASTHFLQNTGCMPASTISIFDNSDPGVVDTANALNLPDDTAQLTLGNGAIGPNVEVQAMILMQSQECLARCGLL